MQKILVWDWPVRVGHWLMAGAFCLAWLTADSESYRLVHVFAGAVVLGVATFRLPWGFIGTRYARLSNSLAEAGHRLESPEVEISALCPKCVEK